MINKWGKRRREVGGERGDRRKVRNERGGGEGKGGMEERGRWGGLRGGGGRKVGERGIIKFVWSFLFDFS